MAVSIKQMTDMDHAAARELLNFENAEVGFKRAFASRRNLYSVWNDSDLAGVAQIKEAEQAYLYLWIDAFRRSNGIGDQALRLFEELLSGTGAATITTTYRTDHAAAQSFAHKHGYKRNFSSHFMQYNGLPFDLPPLPVREYRDEDYASTHSMYAMAFHEMRVRVGYFPDSTIEEPSDSMRENWTSTKKDRLVYVHDGEIIGYAHLVGGEIGSISIEPQYQGRGFGRMFLKFIINKILSEGNQTVSLYCITGNWAKGLYDSLGFTDEYPVEIAVKSLRESPAP